jgi:hypothetical protein
MLGETQGNGGMQRVKSWRSEFLLPPGLDLVKELGQGADGRMIEQAKSTAANVTDRENLNK